MTTQLRVLFLAAIVALAAGWVGLRRGNDDLARRLAAAEARP